MKDLADYLDHLEFIDFDGRDVDDGDAMTSLGWPRLRASYQPIFGIDSGATDHIVFCALDLYTPDATWSLWDSKLRSFEWRVGTDGDTDLCMTFKLRGSGELLSLKYKNPQFHGETSLSTEFHSLYLQALGRSNGRYRHEFIFQNACLIVSADRFAFSLAKRSDAQ